MGVSEIRVTSFRALNDVTLTQIGASIDPALISVFEWKISTNGRGVI
jgi:hypothetical protein